MAALYAVEPAFQARLLPATTVLQDGGVTPDQMTLLAAGLSVGEGAALCFFPEHNALWHGLLFFLFFIMALNAIDGLLPRLTVCSQSTVRF
ncbi:hypothetical protein [Actimicrobium antarcticum]|uniref:Uncharacterized protein n=1 Tax=Actimicrobium antarcticum TaxID=1051899 RepID=A0ABP7TT33_9BURK